MFRTTLGVIFLTALCACEEIDRRPFERDACDAVEDLEREHELDEREFDEHRAVLEHEFDEGLEDLERQRDFEREELEQDCEEDLRLYSSPERTGPHIPVAFDHSWSHVLDPALRPTHSRKDEARDRDDDECHDAREDLEREFDELREDLERERELEREDLERLRDEARERFEREAEDLERECAGRRLSRSRRF